MLRYPEVHDNDSPRRSKVLNDRCRCCLKMYRRPDRRSCFVYVRCLQDDLVSSKLAESSDAMMTCYALLLFCVCCALSRQFCLCVVSCVMCNMLRLPSTADRQQVLVDACMYVRNSSDGIYRQLRQFPVLLLVCMSTAGSMTGCCYATAARLLLRDCYATATQLLLPVSVRLLVL